MLICEVSIAQIKSLSMITMLEWLIFYKGAITSGVVALITLCGRSNRQQRGGKLKTDPQVCSLFKISRLLNYWEILEKLLNFVDNSQESILILILESFTHSRNQNPWKDESLVSFMPWKEPQFRKIDQWDISPKIIPQYWVTKFQIKLLEGMIILECKKWYKQTISFGAVCLGCWDRVG